MQRVLLGLGDVDIKECVRPAQRGLDVAGRLTAREDEAQVAVSLRKRHHGLPGRDRDLDSLDAVDRARPLDVADVYQCAAPWNRDHHHARGSVVESTIIDPEAERMPENQLLETYSGPEPQSS